MQHFVEISVAARHTATPHHLMSALFNRLHLQLVETGHGEIAVTFPAYSTARVTLGDRLRLVGPAASLARLMGKGEWLGHLRHHVEISPAKEVPSTAKPVYIRRQQAKSSTERLRRRKAGRTGQSIDQVRAQMQVERRHRLRLPFVRLTSSTNGHSFPVFIALAPAPEGAVAGEFNTYGLSQTATVPWF